MIGPIFVAMAAEPEYQGINFRKCDVDKASEVSKAAEIQAMPTFIIFKGGAEAERIRGASEEALRAMLARHM